MHRFSRFLLLPFFAIVISTTPARAEELVHVAASFSVLADLVREIGGGLVQVSSLVPVGVEPHDWEPLPRDIAILGKADLVVVNGLGLEGWLDRLIAASGYEGPVLVASRQITPILSKSGEPDPHAWHSLEQVKLYVAAISEELSRVDPQHGGEYAVRRDDFLRTLTIVSRAVELAVSTIPPERRLVFATHNAFAYLERDHGIAVLSPVGPDSSAQGSAKGLAMLVGRIRESRAKAVFPEAGGEGRLAHVMADEAGVVVGEPLYAGTLSGPDGPAPNFIEMWSHNVFLMLEAMTP